MKLKIIIIAIDNETGKVLSEKQASTFYEAQKKIGELKKIGEDILINGKKLKCKLIKKNEKK